MFGLFRKKLPHCDILFARYFSLWYDEGDRPKMTRPDMYQIAAFQGVPLDIDNIQYLPKDHLPEVDTMLNVTMTKAALKDFQYIYETDNITLELLDAVDKFYDRGLIAELISASVPAEFSNQYLVTVCEFGVLLGQLFRQHEGYDWLYSHPYFHSIIVHQDTGFGITVFDWAVKKFSGYGVDDGYVAKFHAAVEAINEHVKHKDGK